ncbi:MAG: gamma-glutamylcyclotransferase [Rhodospirillaceae bacterium]|nr:gamma-glutamylcyclotransferase [Rhodospirillaceae bacterium]
MLYFAYGANVNQRNIKRHAPRARAIGVARLAGYKLVFKQFADIVKDPKGAVTGVLYELTPACELALDRYEDVPKLYRKLAVTVESDQGPGEAMVYVMNGGEKAPPELGYFNIIARGYADWKLDAKILRDARFATLRR